MPQTYASAQWRQLAARGFRYNPDGYMTRGPLSYFVPPSERTLAYVASCEAGRGDALPDVECRECEHEFTAGHLGACPACGSRQIRRIPS